MKDLWFLVPIGIFFLFLASTFDLTLSNAFYQANPHTPLHFQQSALISLLYTYGELPALLLGCISITAYVCSFLFKVLAPYRKDFLYLFLVLSAGSGLLINVALKDHWGRPRPKQITQFGGRQPFQPFYKPRFFYREEPARSFPSGHASMGFSFFSLYFLARKYNKRGLALFFFFFSLLFGSLLSYARIAAGGHFLSDTVASFLIMFFVSATLSHLFQRAFEEGKPSLAVDH